MQNKITLCRIGILGLFLTCSLSTTLVAQNIKWHSFEDALAIADTSQKSILVDIWAPWCGWCYKMKNEVYPAISPAITDHFILTRLNRDDHDTIYTYKGRKLSSARLARELGAHNVPSIVLLTAKGEHLHLRGYIKTKTLERVLRKVITSSSQ